MRKKAEKVAVSQPPDEMSEEERAAFLEAGQESGGESSDKPFSYPKGSVKKLAREWETVTAEQAAYGASRVCAGGRTNPMKRVRSSRKRRSHKPRVLRMPHKPRV